MIGLSGEMFLGHFSDGRRIENPGGTHQGGVGQVLSPAFQILLKPGGHRHGKAGFFSLQDGFRKIFF